MIIEKQKRDPWTRREVVTELVLVAVAIVLVALVGWLFLGGGK